MRNLIWSSNPIYRPLQDFFNLSEYVLVGHNGVFCSESCGIIHIAKKANKCVGLLGSGIGIGPIGRAYKGWLYRRAMDEANFCFFRDRYTIESIRRICHSSDKLILAPDPAFAMQAAEQEAVRQVLEPYERYRYTRESGRKIVGVTALEKGVVYKGFKPELKEPAKRQAHAKYLAKIFDSLIREKNVFVIFLPHSIEKDYSDVAAAEHICEAMLSDPDNYMILDQDLEARLLKGIIKECDFLVGERAHSIIGSVGIATPFVAMTNRADLRIHGIIGDMCQCQEQIIDMDVLDEETSRQKVLALFDARESIKKSLMEIRGKLLEQLDAVSKIIKSHKKDSNK
jgi:polysaccharide pyruvyl transferase WcaK-like protein